RGYLVVLLVGSARFDGDRTLSQLLDECFQASLLRFDATRRFLAQALAQEAPNADADQCVWNAIGLEQRRVPGVHRATPRPLIQPLRFGGQGMKALVVSWYRLYSSPRERSACASVAGMPVTRSRKYRMSAGEISPIQP